MRVGKKHSHLVPFVVVLIVLVCVVQVCKRFAEGGAKTAQDIAKMLVDQAREKRMKDNRSVIIKDFVMITRIRSSFHSL
jgi:hypothetical protein